MKFSSGLALVALCLGSAASAQSAAPAVGDAATPPTTKILLLKVVGRGRLVFRGQLRVAGNGGTWLTGDLNESVSCRATALARNTGAETFFRLFIASNPVASEEIKLALSSSPAPSYDAVETSCKESSDNARVFERAIRLEPGHSVSVTLDDYHVSIRQKQ